MGARSVSRLGLYSEKVNMFSGREEAKTPTSNDPFSNDLPEERPGTRSGFRSIFSRSKSQISVVPPAIRTGRHLASRDSSYNLYVPLERNSLHSSSHSSNSRANTLSTRTSGDPPPLFQVYPQALKYANLDASCLSTQSILRLSRRRQSNASPNSNIPAADLDEINSSQQRMKKHTKAVSIDSGGWSKKLYVLVTSGYLLQYASEGHHDRLPEKMLQLSERSIAFASDAIPGKHWVLQVSHEPAVYDDEAVSPPKTMWSRIGFHSTTGKRTAKDMLLICDSPEELDSWLVTVRGEIEAQGGLQYRSETPTARSGQPVLEHKISQRFRVQRDPYQFSQTHVSAPGGDRCEDDNSDNESIQDRPAFELLPEIRNHSEIWIGHGSTFLRSWESGSDSSLISASDLDGLRDSSHWQTSTGTATRTSVDDSISSVSPVQDRFPLAFPSLTTKALPAPPVAEIQPLFEINKISATPPQTSSSIESHSPREPQDVKDSLQLGSDVGVPRPRPLSGMPNFSLPTNQRLSRCSLLMSESSSSSLSTESLREIADDVGEAAPRERSSEVESEKPKKQRPTSIVAPLPSRDAIGRMGRPRIPALPETLLLSSHVETDGPVPSNEKVSRPQTDVRGHSASHSTGSYTLFPRHYSSVDLPKVDAPSGLPDIVLLEPSPGSHQRSSSQPVRSTTTPIKKLGDLPFPTPSTLRRAASMLIVNTRAPASPIPEAKRSPAVNGTHFASNFGTATPFTRSSSLRSCASQNSSAPNLSRAYVSQMRAGPSLQAFPPPKRLSTSGQTRKVSMIGPPLSSPPSCPLPSPPPPDHHSRDGSSISNRVYLDLTRDEPRVMGDRF